MLYSLNDLYVINPKLNFLSTGECVVFMKLNVIKTAQCTRKCYDEHNLIALLCDVCHDVTLEKSEK